MQLAQLLQLREAGIPVPSDLLLEASTLQNKKQLVEAVKKTEEGQAKMAQDQKESEARIGEAAARSWKMQQDVLEGFKKLAIVQAKMTSEQEMKALDMMHKIDNDQAKTLIDAHKAKTDGEHQNEKMLRESALRNKEIDTNAKVQKDKGATS